MSPVIIGAGIGSLVGLARAQTTDRQPVAHVLAAGGQGALFGLAVARRSWLIAIAAVLVGTLPGTLAAGALESGVRNPAAGQGKA